MQVPVRPLGVDTRKFVIGESVKPIPVSAVAVFGLLIVKVIVVVPTSESVAAPNASLTVGGWTTVTTAVLLVVPVPPSVEVIAVVVLLLLPGVVPVTLPDTVHDAPAARVPPEITIVVVFVPLKEAPQLLLKLTMLTERPAGRLSVNPIPFSVVPLLGLLIVKVNETVPFSGTVAAPKDLVIVGGATTVRVAVLLVVPAPLSVAVTTPVVLFCAPAVMPVTFTENIQDPLAASVALARLTLFVPWVAVIDPPPQLPVKPFGVATTRPPGNVSLNVIPLSEALELGLLIVKISEVELLSAMLPTPKDLLIVGGCTVLLAISHRPRPCVAARSTRFVLWIPISKTATRGRPVP